MKTRSIQLMTMLFLGAFAASADQYTWGNTYAQVWQGFGTSPYSAINTATNASITLFCLDFNDEIAPPYTWNANIWTLAPSSVQSRAQYGGNYDNLLNNAYNQPGKQAPNQITGVPFAFIKDDAGAVKADLTNSPDPYTRYLEAAWLFKELQGAGTQSPLALVAQAAAWNLFVNPANRAELAQDINTTPGTFTFMDYVDSSSSATPMRSGLSFAQAVDYALNAAQSAVVTNKTFAATGWTIVTGDPDWVESGAGKTIPAQEFLSPNAGPGRMPPVPEPAGIFLLAAVAGVLGFAKHRKNA